eukprot:g21937.t1
MIEQITEIWNQFVQGEIITEQDLWWALLVCMLFAALHLVTMLVTRWGDHQATSKSLIFSVLVHLSCGMGLVAMNPPEVPAKVDSTEKKVEEKDPFQFRKVLLAGSETFETDESGNTPFYRKMSKPVKIALARRQPVPMTFEPPKLPSRDKVSLEPIDKHAEPTLPKRAETPAATPAPGNSGEVGPLEMAKVSERIIDPTTQRQPKARVSIRQINRTPIQRSAQDDIPVFRERKRGAVDKVANVLDLSAKSSADEAQVDPGSFLKRGQSRALPRVRKAPAPSVVESDTTGSPTRQNTAGTGGGQRKRLLTRRIPTRPTDGVRVGSDERFRPDKRPTTPRPQSRVGEGVAVAEPGNIDRERLQPEVSGEATRIPNKRRTGQLPATYRLRSLAKRKASAEKYGGTDASERAVEKALRWLAKHQHPDGYWDADLHGSGKVRFDERGTERDYAGKDSDTGVTALALLAFLGAGYTHEEGQYARTVDKALRWIVSQQREDGFLGGNARHYAKMYCHGMATYALGEAYAMQSDPTVDTRLRKPLSKAVAYILDTQSTTDGGWRYLKGQISDVSMFGWQLMALKSAETAGIAVPDEAKRRMVQFLLDHSSGPNKGLASYQKRYKVSETMTAEALFCKQIFRIPRNHPASKEAAEYILARKPRRSRLNLYYWYYGTLAMYQYGGKEWKQWNDAVRDALVAEQSTTGDNDGSWDPKGPWGKYGGRVYSTALSALCLEVYYRFLPLYKMSGQRDASYARQFLGQMPKPDVDSVSGLAPSISIQQKVRGRNPRSTVGTITEIYDYLRVLMARVGQGHCERCGNPITAQTVEQILEHIAQIPEGTRFQILAPIIQRQKGEYRDLFEDLLKQGFLRARVDGTIVQLTDDLKLDRQMRHTIEVVVDRLSAGKSGRSRITEAVESALKLSKGSLIVTIAERDFSETPASARKKSKSAEQSEQTTDQLFSAHYACTTCGISYEPPSPQLFSFNSPLGMCHECNGLGMRHDFLVERLIPNEKKTVQKGAIELIGPVSKIGRWRRHIIRGAAAAIESDLDLPADSVLKTPWNELPEEARHLFLYGMGDRNITFSWRYSGGTWKHGGTWDGVIPDLLESYRKAKNPMRRRQLEKFMDFTVCQECHGARLNGQARGTRLTSASGARQPTGQSRAKKSSKKRSKKSVSRRGSSAGVSLSLPEICSLSIAEASQFFEELVLDDTGRMIAEEALKEIRGRLGFLLRCGLDYLALDRTAPTLSGGESQRIRLAGQIGCGLVGVVYILDEPSIGLHPRDNDMLLESLCDLRDQGNTVIVVEHDEVTMRAADHIVDFGPGPGVRGGEVVAEGTLKQIRTNSKSVTGRYLSGKESIAIPKERRTGQAKKNITIKGATHHNLKNVDATFPLGTFICVTGVSGSGKSSLVNDILWQSLNRDLNKGKGTPGPHKTITGLQHLDKAIDIDQSPIGRTPRSNPATYVKLFDLIRNLYTQLPESRVRGYKAGRFSFNVDGGRCEACDGYGSNKLEMDFLADVWVTCPVCNGRRFNHETLEVRYKGRNIAEVLDMDVQEAVEHFRNVPKVLKLLQTLHDVGLDYIKLGQPSPTLSGGEAQRVKLARELGKRSTGSTMYLLDEPTTGLHFADIQKLLEVLHGFVDAGNTVLVIEHNLDVIKTADYIIDLGPEGGAGGGTIVATGTPEEIAECDDSYTGRALCEVLGVKTDRRKRTAVKKSAARVNGQQSADRSAKSQTEITIRGAAQHNLQHLDLTVPRDKMSVFCGPSGSGKSSLAMDTLYAEGQRRYVESLSAYARQFLGQMPKPRVEHIHGLSPAIAIEQKATGSTPRSTVGTVTEIYDYLRILFARLGTPYCPECDVPVETQTTDEVIDRILEFPEGTKLILLAPQEVTVGQKYETFWERLKSQGFLRVRIDGTTFRLDDTPEIDRRRKHDVEIVVDRISVAKKSRSRIADSVESAFDAGRGELRVAHYDDARDETEWRIDHFSLHRACQQCGRSFEELTPHNFSFNSSLGWCEACEGLGVEQGTNLAALIADPKKSLAEAAISAWPDPATNALFAAMLDVIAGELKIPLDQPFDQLEPAHQRAVLYGTDERWYEVAAGTKKNTRGKEDAPLLSSGFRFQYKGLYPAIEEAARVSYVYRQRLNDLVGEVPCSWCHGSRLRDDASAVRFRGKTLQQVCAMPLAEALSLLQEVKLSKPEKKIAGDLLHEATSRLSFLVEVGLTYLSLSRSLPSLSGGEQQRIRLAGQIGRALTGVLYVLDEPTIGLHPRDNDRLLRALHKLRDLGNTLVLVEHDREVLVESDRLYDFGPGAGRFGGMIVGEGTPKQLQRKKASLTGQYLSEKKSIPIPENRRMDSVHDAPDGNMVSLPTPGEGWLELLGAKHHNLRDVDLRIPLGTLTCITGVSGSGKSSLIEDTLAKAIAKRLHRAGDNPAPFDELLGLENVNKVISVDQRPLGSTPASNPATYTGVFDHIRELFSRLPDAKVRGYRPARFSFNRQGGRCDDCEGNGQKCIEMHFLPDVWVECETCRGARYNRETLAVQYRGKSIADVLNMSIGDALKLFENIPKIRGFLAVLSAIGLDYLTLGQSAPTLSGGEAQRVKLAAELARPDTGKTLYILDEPTTGLHFDDIDKLLKVLNGLVDRGNTVVVIEHNLDVIKTADWLVDVGPEAGFDGGQIVAVGTPEDLVAHHEAVSNAQRAPAGNSKSKKRSKQENQRSTRVQQSSLFSYTGQMLEPVLNSGDRTRREVFDAAAAAKKRDGDLDLKQVGKNAKMPWQIDGRKWHTESRLSHSGKPCRWDGAALATVVDAIESRDGFAEAKWNDRAVVEVKAKHKAGTWFFHSHTGDEWTLKLIFRVPKKTFTQDELNRKINLTPFDNIDEIPVYGRGDRVRVKNSKGPWQEITVTTHGKEDVETPEFSRFLKEAGDAFLGEARKAKANPADLMPWKVLGRKWHLMRKGFPSGKRVKWNVEALEQLLALLEDACPDGEFDWSSKSVVHIRRKGDTNAWASIHTKRREGIDLSLFQPPGTVALGRIARLAAEREIAAGRDGREVVKLRDEALNSHLRLNVAPAALEMGDHVVIVLYLLAMLWMGFSIARKQKSTDDFFVGGRNLPSWAVGISLFASLLSTITYLGMPGEMFRTGVAFLTRQLPLPIVLVVVCFLWIPFFMRLKLTSAYEYLEQRFDYTTRALSAIFCLLLLFGWISVVVLTASSAMVKIVELNVPWFLGTNQAGSLVADDGSAILMGNDFRGDAADYRRFIQRVRDEGTSAKPSPGKRIWQALTPEARKTWEQFLAEKRDVDAAAREQFDADLTAVLRKRDFYNERAWKGVELGNAATSYLGADVEQLTARETSHLNRALIQSAYPEQIARAHSAWRDADMHMIILSVGLFSVLYTTMGGIRAVIWTDVIQFLVLMVGAIFTMAFIAWDTNSGLSDWLATSQAYKHESVEWFQADVGDRSNVAFISLGMMFWFISTHGSNQVALQRYFTVKSVWEARKSYIVSAVASIFIGVMLAGVGISLMHYIESPENDLPAKTNLESPLKKVRNNAQDSIFPEFIGRKLPWGLRGMVVAALFAAAMSTIDSGSNSASTIVTVDFLRRKSKHPPGGPEELKRARLITATSGVIVVGYTMMLYHVSKGTDIITLCQKGFNCFLGPLGAVFVLGMFSKRVTAKAVVPALLLGEIVGVCSSYSEELFAVAFSTHLVVVTSWLVTIVWDGQDYQLPESAVAYDGAGNAIHGFCLDRPWRVVDQGQDFVEGEFQLSQDAPDRVAFWPTDFVIQIRYSVADAALDAIVTIKNPSEKPLPWGFGTHPYFRVPLSRDSRPENCLVEAPPKSSTAQSKEIETLRKRIEKLEADIAKIKGNGKKVPGNAKQQKVLTLLETPYLGTSYYSSPNKRFFVARVLFVNLTPKPVVIKKEDMELSFDGKTYKAIDVPSRMRYQSFTVGTSSFTLNNLKPKAQLTVASGGTGSTWVVFPVLPSGRRVPAMLLNMNLAGKKSTLNINDHAIGSLGLAVDRIGPRESLGLITLSGRINTISAGGLVNSIEDLVKKKVTRIVIRWTKSAPVLDSNTRSWLYNAANNAGRGTPTNHANFPTMPTSVRELHLAQIPGTTTSTNSARSFGGPTTATQRIHKTDIDAVMVALKTAYEVLPRDELVREIEQGHPLTRAAALAGGGGRLSADKLPVILKYADDKDPKLQQAALIALKHFGEKEAIAKLVHYARKNAPPLSAFAVSSLAASRYTAAHNALIEILKNEPPKSRIEIVKILAAYPRPIWSETIYEFVKDSNSGVGVEALKALGIVGHPKLVDVLSDALKTGDSAIRSEAFRQLVSRTDSRSETIAMEYSLKLMEKSAPTSQIYSLLRRTKDQRAIPLLLNHLDRSSGSRSTIIDVLSQIGDQTVGEKLAARYSKLSSDYERAAVLRALVRLKSPRFRALAGKALMTKNSSLVSAACEGLRTDGTAEAVQMLADALDKSTYSSAWSYTSNALAEIGTPVARAALRRARESKNQSKRQYGINGLRSVMQRSPGYQYVYQAKQSSRQRKPKEAADFYALAIKLDPNLSEAYSGRGHAYLHLKKYKEAKADFMKAVKLDSYDALAITGLGVVLSLEGKIEQAIKQVEDSREKFKSNSLYAYNTACVYGRALEHAQKSKSLPDRQKKIELYRSKAIADLQNSVKLGYSNLKAMKEDPDLASLEGLPEFEKIHSPKGSTAKPPAKRTGESPKEAPRAKEAIKR